MTTSYPAGQDNFTRPQAADPLDNPSHSQLHDDAFDAIEAIEAELGLGPAGSFATVVARLNDVDSQIAGKADAGHTHAAGDAQTLEQCVSFCPPARGHAQGIGSATVWTRRSSCGPTPATRSPGPACS